MPARLTQPLVREDGSLRPATWDEALARVATGLTSTIDAHGPDAVGMFACSKATNEVNYLAQKLVRAGDRHEQHRLLQPHLTRSLASSVWRQSSVPVAARAATERRRTPTSIVLWGSNARETHPIFFHHVLKGVHNGARLFVVDPRRTSTAQFADRWLGLDVGTDIALANTVGPRDHRTPGSCTTDFVERATDGFDEYAASVEPWTLERGEEITGVPAERHPRPRARLRQGRARRSCAGRSASPSTTTRSTTCSR